MDFPPACSPAFSDVMGPVIKSKTTATAGLLTLLFLVTDSHAWALVKNFLLLGHRAGPGHGRGTGYCGTGVNANTLVFDPACESICCFTCMQCCWLT